MEFNKIALPIAKEIFATSKTPKLEGVSTGKQTELIQKLLQELNLSYNLDIKELTKFHNNPLGEVLSKANASSDINNLIKISEFLKVLHKIITV